ncbi:MAG: DMT family transporter [Chloroflexi bacterium]|nr:DMT family transporter [Chloroflexota bacterium]
MPREQRDGLLFILLAAVGYACFPIFTKFIYADPALTPLDVVTWRFIFAAPLVWLTLRLLRAPQPPSPLPRLKLVGLGVLFAMLATCAFFSLSLLPASLYTVLLYTYPAMVAIISLLIGDRLPLRGWIALALTLVGVVLTVPNLGEGGTVTVEGLLITLIGNCLLYAIYLVLSGRVMRANTAAGYAIAWGITGSLLTVLLLIPLRGLTVPTIPSAWFGLIALALFSTIMPGFAMLAGIGRLGASRAAILSTTEPVMTIVLALLLLPGETMTALQIFGAALVLISVVLLQLPSRSSASATS